MNDKGQLLSSYKEIICKMLKKNKQSYKSQIPIFMFVNINILLILISADIIPCPQKVTIIQSAIMK